MRGKKKKKRPGFHPWELEVLLYWYYLRLSFGGNFLGVITFHFTVKCYFNLFDVSMASLVVLAYYLSSIPFSGTEHKRSYFLIVHLISIAILTGALGSIR